MKTTHHTMYDTVHMCYIKPAMVEAHAFSPEPLIKWHLLSDLALCMVQIGVSLGLVVEDKLNLHETAQRLCKRC